MKFPISPRWLELGVSIWLLLSAFLWEHTGAQFTNSWVIGALAALTAAASLRFDDLRYATAGFGLWLLASVWVLPVASESTLWNNLLVALVLFVTALSPAVRSPLRLERFKADREQSAAQRRRVGKPTGAATKMSAVSPRSACSRLGYLSSRRSQRQELEKAEPPQAHQTK